MKVTYRTILTFGCTGMAIMLLLFILKQSLGWPEWWAWIIIAEGIFTYIGMDLLLVLYYGRRD